MVPVLHPESSTSSATVSRARTFLFVPGNRPERFDKALASGADVVIVDLEDSVAPEDKERSRASLAKWLDPTRPVVVRINPAGSIWFDDDLAGMSPAWSHSNHCPTGGTRDIFDAGGRLVAGACADRDCRRCPRAGCDCSDTGGSPPGDRHHRPFPRSWHYRQRHPRSCHAANGHRVSSRRSCAAGCRA